VNRRIQRLVRACALAAAVAGATGCTARYLTLDYQHPARALRSSVTAAKVTRVPANPEAPLQIVIDVQAPQDSALVLALGRRIKIDRLREISIQDATVIADSTIKRLTGERLEQVQASGNPAALRRTLPGVVEVRTLEDSLLELTRICPRPMRTTSAAPIGCPPGSDTTLIVLEPGRDTSVVLIVDLPREHRVPNAEFQVRLNWISIPVMYLASPAALQRGISPACPRVEAAFCDRVAFPDAAQFSSLTARTRFLRVNYRVVPIAATTLISAVFLVAGA
jgi:hypothetical protein